MFKSIVYFGAEIRIAKLLMRYGKLKVLISEPRQTSQKLKEFCIKNNIKHYELDTLFQLKKIPLPDQLGVMYGFGIILDNKIIDMFKFGVWNIHTGKLPENRGRHPIGWSLINGDEKAWVSIHRINDQIDQGILLSEHSTTILKEDNELSIRKRLEKITISYGFFNAIKNFQANKIISITDGTYWPSLKGKWDEIDPKCYNSTFLLNLNKAKQSYGGYKVNGKKYKYCKLFIEKPNNKLKNFLKLKSLDNRTMIFYND